MVKDHDIIVLSGTSCTETRDTAARSKIPVIDSRRRRNRKVSQTKTYAGISTAADMKQLT